MVLSGDSGLGLITRKTRCLDLYLVFSLFTTAAVLNTIIQKSFFSCNTEISDGEGFSFLLILSFLSERYYGVQNPTSELHTYLILLL